MGGHRSPIRVWVENQRTENLDFKFQRSSQKSIPTLFPFQAPNMWWKQPENEAKAKKMQSGECSCASRQYEKYPW